MTAPTAIDSARRAALFVSVQQHGDVVGEHAIRDAIDDALCEFGASGCTARVAEEFGDHPDTAVDRMRSVLALLAQTFTPALR